jgi:Ca2+-binding RTX toxin-like protein
MDFSQLQFDTLTTATGSIDPLPSIVPGIGRSGSQSLASPRLTLVDSRLDWQGLVGDDRLIIELKSDRDGLDQISEVLANYQDLSGIEILSHGRSGQLLLGNSWVDLASLESRSTELQTWGSALAIDGDLRLYGCDVAGNTTFVDRLAALTGADVGASVDVTGAAALGGDWELEYWAGGRRGVGNRGVGGGELGATGWAANYGGLLAGPTLLTDAQVEEIQVGLLQRFSALQSGIDGWAAGRLPIVGTGLAGVTSFFNSSFLTTFNGAFDTLQSTAAATYDGDQVRTALFNAIGSVLGDRDGNSIIDVNDIGFVDTPGVGSANGTLKLDFKLGQSKSANLALDLGFPALELGALPSLATNVGYAANLQFTIGDSTFAIADRPDDLVLTIKADATPIDTTGKLGLLDFAVTGTPIAWGGDVTLDVTQTGTSLTSTFGTAQVNLDLVSQTISQFPSIKTGLTIDWSPTAAPIVTLKDLKLDLDQFVNSFLKPINDQLDLVMDPLKPVIDLLTSEIPVLGIRLADLVPGNELDRFIDAYQGLDSLRQLTGTGDIVLASQIKLNDLLGAGTTFIDSSVLSGANLTGLAPVLDSQLTSFKNLEGTIGATFPVLTSPKAILQLLMGDRSAQFFELNLPGVNVNLPAPTIEIPILPIPLQSEIFDGGFQFKANIGLAYDAHGFTTLANGGSIFDGFYLKGSSGLSLIGELSAGTELGVNNPIIAAALDVTASLSGNITTNLTDPNSDGKVRSVEMNQLLAGGPLSLFKPDGTVDLGIYGTGTAGIGPFRTSISKTFFEQTLVDFGFDDSGNIEPRLATLTNGNLRLNMGRSAGQRGFENTAFNQDNNEVFKVEHVSGTAGNETVKVTAFGVSQVFNGVSKILAEGGEGNDTIDLSSGVKAESILWGDFDPAIGPATGAEGNDRLSAGLGLARLYGGGGNDYLTAEQFGPGNVAPSRTGLAYLYGGNGDDELAGSEGTDYLFGNAGRDQISGNGGDDYLYGDRPNETSTDLTGINSATSADFLNGGVGNDQLFGELGDDGLAGQAGNDLLWGSVGNDQLWGQAGNDILRGDEDNDELDGGDNDDVLFGAIGDDLLQGGNGNDSLLGGMGDDTLRAGAGADVLIGDVGDDDLDGGSGDDRYLFAEGWGDDFVSGDAGGDDTWNFDSQVTILDQVLTLRTTTDLRFTLQNDWLRVDSEGGQNSVYKANFGIEVLKGGTGRDRYDIYQTAPAENIYTPIFKGNNNSTYSPEILMDGQGGSDLYIAHFASRMTNPPTWFNGKIWDTGVGSDDFDQVRALGTAAADWLTISDESVYASFDEELITIPNPIQPNPAPSTPLLWDNRVQRLTYHKSDTESGIETLYVDSLAGEDTVHIASTTPQVMTEVTSGDSDDKIILGGASLNGIYGANLNPIKGGSGYDTFIIDDSADTTQNEEQGVLTERTISGLGIHGVVDYNKYSDIERVEVYLGRVGDDFLVKNTIAGPTTINAGAGDDIVTLELIDGVTTVNGNDGNDILDARQLDQTIYLGGGLGNDRILGGSADDQLRGDGDFDIPYNQLADLISFTSPITGGNDVIIGASGTDTIFGEAGNDGIIGGQTDLSASDSPDYIFGGAGDDRIIGVNGMMTTASMWVDISRFARHLEEWLPLNRASDEASRDVYALADWLPIAPESDLLFGDEGILSFTTDNTIQTISSKTRSGYVDEIAGDLTIAEGLVTQTDGNDTIQGSRYLDDLIFGGGNGQTPNSENLDRLRGDQGADIIIGDAGRIEFSDWRSGQVTRITTTESGEGGADRIEGNAGQDIVLGGAGADLLRGDAAADLILGDEGIVTFEVDGVTVKQARTTIPTSLIPTQITNANGADMIYGNGSDDLILGGGGGDEIHGSIGFDHILADFGVMTFGQGALLEMRTTDATLGGNDRVYGEEQTDIIFGGGGDDDLSGGEGSDWILGDGGIVVYKPVGTELVIDRLETTDPAIGGKDYLQGDRDEDILFGGANDDQLDGGLDGDLMLGDNGKAVFVDGSLVQLVTTNPTIGGNDRIYGNDQPNSPDYIGSDGDDVVLGGFGDDWIDGQGGDDRLFGDNGQIDFNGDGGIVQILTTEPGIGGADRIRGGDGSDVIVGGFGADILGGNGDADLILGDNGRAEYATAGDDRINPDSDTKTLDRLIVTDPTLGGNDRIVGGEGDDRIAGGTGNDRIFGDYVTDGDLDLLQVGAAGPVLGEIGFYDDVILGDHAILYPDRQHLDSIQPIFTGANLGAGNDWINGNQGDDLILGQQGNDRLDGDAGEDDLIGGQTIVGSPDGNDTINGGDDGDVAIGDNGLITRRPDGAGGWQRYVARPGQGRGDVIRDVTRFDDREASLGIPNAWGNDIVRGDDGEDILFGQRGDDWIEGGNGDDEAYGQLGNDVMLGGAGRDVLLGDVGIINRAYNANGSARLNADGSWHKDAIVTEVADLIALYDLGQLDLAAMNAADLVLLSGLYRADGSKVLNADGTWANSAELLRLAPDGNDYIDGGADIDVVLGQGGNDTLLGDAGDDYVEGGLGDDTLAGGAGDDYLIGDDGATEQLIATQQPNITHGIQIINVNAGIDRQINPFGTIVLPGVQLNPTYKNGLVPMLTLQSQQIPTSGIPVIGDLANSRGDRVRSLVTLIPDLANHTNRYAGQDTLSGGAGRDTLVGDNAIAFAAFGTEVESVDQVLADLNRELYQLAYDLHDLEIGIAHRDRSQRAPIVVGQDILNGEGDTDLLIGDDQTIVGAFTPRPFGIGTVDSLSDVGQLVDRFSRRVTGFLAGLPSGSAANYSPTTLFLGNDQLNGNEGDDHLIGDDHLVVAPVIRQLPYAQSTFWQMAFAHARRTGSRNLLDYAVVRGNDTLTGGNGQDWIVGDYSTTLTPLVTSNVSNVTLRSSLDTIANDLREWVRNLYQDDYGLDYKFRDQRHGLRTSQDIIDGGAENDALFGDTVTTVLPIVNGTLDLTSRLDKGHLDHRDSTNNFFQGLPHQQDLLHRNLTTTSWAEDQILGGEGNDLLFGQQRVDRLWGEGGNDELYGGDDTDVMDGGLGSNVLRLTHPSPSDHSRIDPIILARLANFLSPTLWQYLASLNAAQPGLGSSDRLVSRRN